MYVLFHHHGSPTAGWQCMQVIPVSFSGQDSLCHFTHTCKKNHHIPKSRFCLVWLWDGSVKLESLLWAKVSLCFPICCRTLNTSNWWKRMQWQHILETKPCTIFISRGVFWERGWINEKLMREKVYKGSLCRSRCVWGWPGCERWLIWVGRWWDGMRWWGVGEMVAQLAASGSNIYKLRGFI